MDSKKKNLTVCILFGLLLAVAFLACLFLPKEATSDSERRKLAAMPAFTLDTVLSGRFMSGFETYTQDHFPFRDQFRTLKALSATACSTGRTTMGSMFPTASPPRWNTP